MNRKQFQELAAMLREHRRVVDVTDIGTERKAIRNQEIENIETSIIAICKRNNSDFDTDRFLEAARFTETTQF